MSAVEEKTAAPAEQQKTEDKPEATPAAVEAPKATESETPKPEAAASEQAKPEGGDATATPATTDEKKAADGEKKEDDKSFKRLNGAARNRFRWFIKNGYSRDEAAELATDPEKIKEIKEQRELNGNGKRPANGSGNGPASKQAKVANGPIRMVVATEKHPGEKLTTDQVNQIKSAILKQVVLQKDSIDVKPHFEDCSFVDGYLLVQCSDGPTVTWLQDVVPKLELWENANVKVSSEKFLQRADIYVGVFADSLQDSDKDILSFVESQNEGIAASNWTILGRKENKPKKEVELILTMDGPSSKLVFKQKFELNYKFSKVTLLKKKRIAGPPQQNKNANNNNNNRGNNNNRANGQGGQGARRIYNAATSFVPIWDNNLPNFNGGPQRFNNNRNGGGGGFNANRGQGPRNDSVFRNQRPMNGNGNAFGLGGNGNGPRGNQRGGNNRQPRSLIDQLMQTVNSASNGNMGQRRGGPNNGPAFNGGNAGGGRPNNRNNRNNQSRAPRPGFF
ncbi:hypothetical protein pipiens_020138 [Culex pipiens pipiens]|uniref:DUF4780 domain-containing protein n=1 Tax=Culex pipiens pipiens TaxID=38569 RepID=A0ABD1DFG5_CULPP